LEEIHAYVARDSPAAAQGLVERIVARTEKLAAFPLLGATISGRRSDELREVLSWPYRIFYRVLADRVEVVAVVHGARELPP
jgi:plasmid stabilization system protein ParE